MIHLICPSNYFLMPYIDNYLKVIKAERKEYKIVYWNRTQINENVENSVVFSDSLKTYNRGIKYYLKYYLFIRKYINKNSKRDKYIIFSPQLFPIALFIRGSYILDVRDYHKFVKLKIIKRLIKSADFVVISSYRFNEFIQNKKILINHNFNKSSKIIEKLDCDGKIIIANIGAIRDFQANADLIKLFKNKDDYLLLFHGEGPELENLKEYVNRNKIYNVQFTGKYTRDEEHQLYKSAHVINLVRDNVEYNNVIALPNRLYNSAKYNSLILTTKGTALSDIVEKYGLGLSIGNNTSFETINDSIKRKLEMKDDLLKNQSLFLNNVVKENEIFEKNIKTFLRN